MKAKYGFRFCLARRRWEERENKTWLVLFEMTELSTWE